MLCGQRLPCIINAMTARIVGLREAEPVGLHADVAGDLLAYMGRRRISQRRLAATLDVDQSTLSRWFSKGMSVEDLDRVLDALGLRAKMTLIDAETGQPTLPTVVRKFELIKGDGRKSGPSYINSPILHTQI